ncbi:hemolysin III family protein [Candidatus Uabimicrobium sp. HlEnr_7]|uniref:PAQR family membrane homeostasis protein TrhA n=1 Tax=Candidatus Uabimicrobium helgolandensis TaxID=3095367 RepID=UPI003556D58C
MTERLNNEQTTQEELANSLTHGIGLVIAIIAFITFSDWQGNESEVLSLIVYGSTLFFLYAASTLYHTVKTPKLKRIFQILDHSAIYLFIAGCYTPVMFKIGNHDAMIVLTVIWGLAFLGVYIKSFHLEKTAVFGLVLYLLMGWLALVMIKSMIAVLPAGALVWLFAGGASYTLGVYFYVKDSIRFFHTVWHMFVLGGSWCHFHMIIFYTV